MFVILEGIDASGKHTQSKLLAEALRARLYSFPAYDTSMGEVIQAHLTEKWSAKHGRDITVTDPDYELEHLDPIVFQACMLTNKMELAPRIHKAMCDGHNVVCDRYWPSGWVYGAADGLEKYWLEAIHEWLPQPDLFILLEVDPKDSVARRPERRDRYEKQEGLMEKVAELYKELWNLQRSRDSGIEGRQHWTYVDGRRPVGDVHRDILEKCNNMQFWLEKGNRDGCRETRGNR